MFEGESPIMRVLRRLGCERLAWSLRRLHCPVDKHDLVLEVGSGGNPYYRANVLLDAYENTRERHWVDLVTDRPTILGFVENLPFKDKAFDFVIASHVLEHSANPVQFLSELQRVARAGYIEVPDAFMERLNPYLDHRLEITVRDARLLIRKKKAWKTDAELVELYSDRAGAIIAGKTIPENAFHFHVRYYWSGSIDYIVINPEVDAAWDALQEARPQRALSLRSRVNALVLLLLRKALSQNHRNRRLNWITLLRCPGCHGDALTKNGERIICRQCLGQYPFKSGMPHMAIAARRHAEGPITPATAR